MAEWQDIASAPDADCIVTDGEGVCAVAHRRKGMWLLGGERDDFLELLDFEPAFWLPRSIDTNPFRAAFPDGRLTMAQRAIWA